ncbi:hypothetical protein MTP99_013764 [Tenebrio molitor]|nr:hypothetical protein MTP99_013764 [Tenebrio molitor]
MDARHPIRRGSSARILKPTLFRLRGRTAIFPPSSFREGALERGGRAALTSRVPTVSPHSYATSSGMRVIWRREGRMRPSHKLRSPGQRPGPRHPRRTPKFDSQSKCATLRI